MENNQPETASFLSVRSKVLQSINSPLGFFVLALLIVEAFLFGAGIWFHLPDWWKIAAIGVGVLLFLVVFFTVVWLVISYPQNLVFSEHSHVQFAAMKMFGTETKRITITDLEKLSPEPTPEPPRGQPQLTTPS